MKVDKCVLRRDYTKDFNVSCTTTNDNEYSELERLNKVEHDLTIALEDIESIKNVINDICKILDNHDELLSEILYPKNKDEA